MGAAFGLSRPPGVELEKLIQEIQIDVMEHWIGIESICIGGQDCVFKETIQREIDRLRSTNCTGL